MRDEIPVADILRRLRWTPGMLAAAGCRRLSPVEWWAECRRGDLMAHCLPCGRPDTAARRRLVALLCRFAALAAGHRTAGESWLGAAVDAARRWADGCPEVTEARLRGLAARRLPYPTGDAAACADAAALAPVALALSGEPGGGRGLARMAAENVASASALAPGAEEEVGVRERMLARMADIVRADFPDVVALLDAKVAEAAERRDGLA